MNLIKRQAVKILKNVARDGIKTLDPASACAQALKEQDVERMLDEDLEKVADVFSMAEGAKIMSLVARLKTTPVEKLGPVKEELKRIGEEALARAEEKSGRLSIPESCRHLLLNL